MAVTRRASELASLCQHQADRLFPPSQRRAAWDNTLDFASRRPAVFTFLAILTSLTLPPLAVFSTFATTLFLLSLGAAILFTLFWTGAALLLLAPTLFMSSLVAVFLWAWTATSFIIARSIARFFGVEISPNGQIRRDDGAVGPFGGVDGKLGGNLEVEGKRFKVEGAIDGKAGGTAWKKETGENGANGGLKTDAWKGDQAPARVFGGY